MQQLLAPYDGRIVIDVGTGDGLFAYTSARWEPEKFFIGLDANRRPLEKISEKIYRKPAKGGLANVLFIQSAVETLPSELDGIASELYVNFPWGSLLQAVVAGDQAVVTNLRSLCQPDAQLTVVVGIDVKRDQSELSRLGLPPLDPNYIESILPESYAKAGFEIMRVESLSSVSDLATTWAKRLRTGQNRAFIRIVAKAIEM